MSPLEKGLCAQLINNFYDSMKPFVLVTTIMSLKATIFADPIEN